MSLLGRGRAIGCAAIRVISSRGSARLAVWPLLTRRRAQGGQARRRSSLTALRYFSYSSGMEYGIGDRYGTSGVYELLIVLNSACCRWCSLC